VVVRCTPEVQSRFHRARWLARRVAGDPLPTWACMEAVAAEVLSALPLADAAAAAIVDSEVDSSSGETEDGCTTHVAPDHPMTGLAGGAEELTVRALRDTIGVEVDPEPASAGAANGCEVHARATPLPSAGAADPATADVDLPPVLASLVDALADADPFEVDERLRRLVALEQRIDAEAADLLATVAAERLHRARGFASLDVYARERLGMSPRRARALLRLARAGAVCPELRDAWRTGRLSWVQAQALVPLILPDDVLQWRSTWIAFADSVSVRRLEDEVERALVLREADPRAFAKSGGLPTDASPSPDLQTGAKSMQSGEDCRPSAPAASVRRAPRETARFFFAAPRDVARLFKALLCSVRRHLEREAGRPVTPGEAAGWMFDHAFAAWGADDPRVPREHRVFARDGWRCTVPGCSSFRNLQDHHVVFRSRGGSDELANRTTLCAKHHLRGIHAGLVRCTGRAPDALHFALGLRGDRPPLLSYVPGERLGVNE
jgi:hypothetical protein